MSERPSVLVVMGVSGAGKTTLAQALADTLGWPFKEGDTLHPPANIAKMAAGRPLDDGDRGPWLDAIGSWIDRWRDQGRSGVVTCSALKRAYRDRLAAGRPGLTFVFVQLTSETIAARLATREGHFMPPSLLASQFATLEPLGADEPAITVDGRLSTDEQAGGVLCRLARFDS
jgi:gluconokinase